MRATPAAALLTAALALTACGSGSPKKTAVAPSPVSPSASTAPSPSPSPKPIGPPSPLNGLPARPGLPVFAVKIDNTAPARPQAGLNYADQVYVEEVEGGLTRLLAVFSSRLPTSVGPVRSVRADNVDLLAEYGGPVAFAYSGGQPGVLAVVRGSATLNASFDAFPADYVRESDRPAPYNLFTNPRVLLKGLKGVQAAKPIGFHFDVTKPPRAGAGSTISVSYPSAHFTFTYRPATHDYAIAQDGKAAIGTDGRPEVAANVVVQHIAQVPSPFKDVNGSFTPANVTVGSAAADVFRDGHPVPAVWQRPTLAAGTRLLTKRTGVDVSLRPGTTWVLLLPPGGGISVT